MREGVEVQKNVTAYSLRHPAGTRLALAGTRGGCKLSVSSTPRVPENEAKRIRRELRHCPHAASVGRSR